MIPISAALRDAGREELLRRGGVGQRNTELPRARQREVQIFLVEPDAKAGIECPRDHSFAVDLEDTARCKAAHQRFAHFCRVGACFSGKHQCFADCLDVERDNDLIGNFGDLA